MVITPERKESVNFSNPYHGTNLLLVTMKDTMKEAASPAASGEGSFFTRLAKSFEKNFIRENRWKMILQGLGTTCVITLLATIFGTILAFGLCLLAETGSRVADFLTRLYVRVMQGTPTVVLLMILYYVVLGRLGFKALWVAVIGFALNFGAYTYEIMKSGIDSIDAGQTEAALALGFTESQTFFRFIYPQASVHFLPVYRGEMISLLKSTSVVGYIAIQDLTKMSDIIRSRTYEAFFPLIATALIYFLLAWIITMVLKAVLKLIDPKVRKRRKGAGK